LKIVNVEKNMGIVKTVKLRKKMQIVKRKIDWWSWIKASYFMVTKKATWLNNVCSSIFLPQINLL
jgi:hypothetical protein